MKQIILEFVGGAWDGMNLTRLSADPVETAMTNYVLAATRGGRHGQRVVMSRDCALGSGSCRYVVAAHIRFENESLVRLEAEAEIEGAAVDGHAPPHSLMLRFVGGCLDGRTIRSDAPQLRESLIATSYFYLIDRGATAKTLTIPRSVCEEIQGRPCPEHVPDRYHVARREEGDRGVTIVVRYCKPED